jgi:hypothetical protein
MKYFRKILSDIDVNPLLEQLSKHQDLWETENVWKENKSFTVLANVSDIVLRSIKGPGHNKLPFTILSEAQKIILDLMRAVPGEHLGQILITKLAPGQIIADHIDHMPPGIPVYWQRYQIPLSVKPGVIFKCGNEEVFMNPGEAWHFNNQVTHSVINNSNEDRISMRADIRPFATPAVTQRAC